MEHICPHCQSGRIVSLNHGLKACSTVGSLAGASVSIHNMKVGISLGRLIGPHGVVIGGISGLVFAGITGAILGGTTGARLGALLDQNVLNNHRCLSCKRSFSLPQQPIPVSPPPFNDEGFEGMDFPRLQPHD